ncbi:MAG: glutaredoxin [Bdellovibrionales bacterium]|nr:glutaredoxin [Bdellovibrionales bacterium]
MVTIYTKNVCPYCVRAKQYFETHSIAYTEINLGNDFDKIEALKLKTGFMTLPQIFVNDQFIGGYTDMIAKIESGELNFPR